MPLSVLFTRLWLAHQTSRPAGQQQSGQRASRRKPAVCAATSLLAKAVKLDKWSSAARCSSWVLFATIYCVLSIIFDFNCCVLVNWLIVLEMAGKGYCSMSSLLLQEYFPFSYILADNDCVRNFYDKLSCYLKVRAKWSNHKRRSIVAFFNADNCSYLTVHRYF